MYSRILVEEGMAYGNDEVAVIVGYAAGTESCVVPSGYKIIQLTKTVKGPDVRALPSPL